MRIGWGMIFAGLFVFLATKGYAATVGNIDPPGLTLSVGADHSSRDVEGDGATLGALTDSRANLPEFNLEQIQIGDFDGNEDIRRIYLRASYGFNRFSIFVRGGTARLTATLFNPVISDDLINTATGTAQGAGGNLAEATHGDISGSTDGGLFYGAGFQVTVLKQPSWRLALSGSYLQQKYDAPFLLYRITERSAGGGSAEEISREARLEEVTTQEIEFAATIRGMVGNFTPYGGIKLSLYKSEYDGKSAVIDRDDAGSPVTQTVASSFSLETQGKEWVGFFVGVNYQLTQKTSLNLELRAGEENGLTAAYLYQF